jgi:hypothetical protein
MKHKIRRILAKNQRNEMGFRSKARRRSTERERERERERYLFAFDGG